MHNTNESLEERRRRDFDTMYARLGLTREEVNAIAKRVRDREAREEREEILWWEEEKKRIAALENPAEAIQRAKESFYNRDYDPRD